MRRSVELILFAATAVALIATSRSYPCASERITYRAVTTCGAAGSVTFTTDARCSATWTGDRRTGLPIGAEVRLNSRFEDAGTPSGFNVIGDGGVAICTAIPADGGLQFDCATLRCGGVLAR